MNENAVQSPAELALPVSLATKADLSRLISELERVDNEVTTASVRAKSGINEHTKISLSDQMVDFLHQNALELNDGRVRTELLKQLRQIKDTAPVIHMTFAATPEPEDLLQLTQWVRTEIHRQAIISIGLQPGLIAGVYLRTPNHVHDLSLRALFKDRRSSLVKELEALSGRS